MNQRLLLRWTAAILGLAAIALGGWYLYTLPRTLSIAVGPEGAPQVRFARAVARALMDTKQPFRLKVVTKADSAAAARALDAKEAQLAILRSDDPTSVEARSIVVVQRRHVLIVSRQDRPVEDIAQFRDRPLGIVRGESDSNRPLVERILAHYEIDPRSANIREYSFNEAADAIVAGQVDGLIFVAWPSQRLRRFLSDVGERRKTPLVLSGAPSADALAFRYRDLQSSELPAGVFGGAPPRPSKSLSTVAITYEIAARADMNDATATDLTIALLEARSRLRRFEESAFIVETPPVDQQRRYLPHDGVAAYVNDETQTLLEEYSDHIWLTLFALSILGSSVTGFLAWAGLREEPQGVGFARRMGDLLEKLRAAQSLADIDKVEAEFDDAVSTLLENWASGRLDPESEPDPTYYVALFGRLVDKRRAAVSRAA